MDASGRKVAYVVTGPAGAGDGVRINIDSKGIVTDTSGRSVGRLIIGAADTTNEIAKVPVDANGNVFDRTVSIFGHVVAGTYGAGPQKQVRFDQNGKMTDASGAVIGQAAVVVRDGFVDKKTQLEARIIKELSANRITPVQADRLNNEIEDVARLEQQYTRDRPLTGAQEASLNAKLTRIWGKLFEFLKMH
ncbi:MAG TPA: DUF3659 domain-containing protein [Candidatus Obscuribacterales bacterium]